MVLEFGAQKRFPIVLFVWYKIVELQLADDWCNYLNQWPNQTLYHLLYKHYNFPQDLAVYKPQLLKTESTQMKSKFFASQQLLLFFSVLNEWTGKKRNISQSYINQGEQLEVLKGMVQCPKPLTRTMPNMHGSHCPRPWPHKLQESTRHQWKGSKRSIFITVERKWVPSQIIER